MARIRVQSPLFALVAAVLAASLFPAVPTLVRAQLSTLSLDPVTLSNYVCNNAANQYSIPSLVFPQFYPTAFLRSLPYSQATHPFNYDPFTLSFFANVAITGDGTIKTIVQSGLSNGTWAAGKLLLVQFNENDQMNFTLGPGVACVTVQSFTSLVDQWHLWSFTYSRTGGLAIYLDGVQVCVTSTSTTMSMAASPIIIGNQLTGVNYVTPTWTAKTALAFNSINFFPGYIADFRIYQRLLTTSELALMAIGIHADNTALFLCYSFNEQNGTVAHDAINRVDAYFSNVTTFMQQRPQWSGLALMPLCLYKPTTLLVSGPSASPKCQGINQLFTVTVSVVDVNSTVMTLFSGQTVGLSYSPNGASSGVTLVSSSPTLVNGVATWVFRSSKAQSITFTSVDSSGLLLTTSSTNITVQTITGIYFSNATTYATSAGQSQTLSLYTGACLGAVIVNGTSTNVSVRSNSSSVTPSGAQLISISSSTGLGSLAVTSAVAQIANFSLTDTSGLRLLMGSSVLAYWASATIRAITIQPATCLGAVPTAQQTFYAGSSLTIPVFAADSAGAPVMNMNATVTLTVVSVTLGTAQSQSVQIVNGVGYASARSNLTDTLKLTLSAPSPSYELGTGTTITVVGAPAAALVFNTPGVTNLNMAPGTSKSLRIIAIDAYGNLAPTFSGSIKVASFPTIGKINGTTASLAAPATVSMSSGVANIVFLDAQSASSSTPVPIYLSMVDSFGTGLNVSDIQVVLVQPLSTLCAAGYESSGVLYYGGNSGSLLQNTGDLVNLGATSFSISAWVYNSGDNKNYIVSQGYYPPAFYQTSSQTTWNSLYAGPVKRPSSLGITFAMGLLQQAGSYAEYNYLMTAQFDQVGKWVHWAFTFDGTTNLQKIYFNGALVAERTATAWSVLGALQGSFQIGFAPNAFQYDGATTAYYAYLAMDDLRLYTRALNDDEPAQIYKYNTYSNSAGLYMHYTFDEMAGQVVHDTGGQFFDVPVYTSTNPQWISRWPNCRPTVNTIVIASANAVRLGNSMNVTVQALDTFGASTVSYNSRVQLVVTGSSTITMPNSGIIQMSSGQGSILLSDTLPENFTLSLYDVDDTGLTLGAAVVTQFYAGPWSSVVFTSAPSLQASVGSALVVLSAQDVYGNQVLNVTGQVTLIINSTTTTPLSGAAVLIYMNNGTGTVRLSDSQIETLKLSLRDDYGLGVTVNSSVITYSTGAPALLKASNYTLTSGKIAATVDAPVYLTLTVFDSAGTACNYYTGDTVFISVASPSGSALGAGTYTIQQGTVNFAVSNTINETVTVSFTSSTLSVPANIIITFAVGAPNQFVFLNPTWANMNTRTLVAGNPASVGVQVQDQYGNAVLYTGSVRSTVTGSAKLGSTNAITVTFTGSVYTVFLTVTDSTAQTVTVTLIDTANTGLSVSSTATLAFGSGACTDYVVVSVQSSAYLDFSRISTGAKGMTAWTAGAYVPFNTSQSVEVIIQCQSHSGLDSTVYGPVLTLNFTSNQTAIIGGPCTMAAGVCTIYFQSFVAGFVSFTVADAYYRQSYNIPAAVPVLFNQNVPVIWSITPQSLTSDGSIYKNQYLTISGTTFMCGQDFTKPPNITFVDSVTGLVGLCTVTFFNATTAVCLVPEGQGMPEVVITVCGTRQLHLPRWPNDGYFYVFSSPPGLCTLMYNLWDLSGHTWGDNSFCTKATRALLDVRFYQPPPPASFGISQGQTPIPAAALAYQSVPSVVSLTHKCTAIDELNEPWGWPNIFLCLPKQAPYDWTLSRTGIIAGSSCVPIREGSDPYWSDGSHYMCTPANTPYPDTDGILLYYYQAPYIQSITPPTANCSGNIVITLRGSSFGMVRTDTNAITVGGKSCNINPARYNHTYVECLLPAGETLFNAVIFTVEGVVASNTPNFPYMPPVINSIAPAQGLTQGGDVITVIGYNFGFSTATVTIGGVGCTIQYYSNTNITCLTPPGVGANQAVYVTTNYQSNLNAYWWSYIPPVVSRVSPAVYDSAGNTMLTVYGSSFGASGATTQVDGKLCPGVTQNHTVITCTLPAGQGANLTVNIIQSGQSASPTGTFSYAVPNITQAPDPLGAASGSGQFLTLTGLSFGTSGTVTVNGAVCDYSNGYYSHHLIYCALPGGSGSNVPVVITVSGQVSNTVLFSYTPVITSVSMLTGQSAFTQGGNALVLQGTGFSTRDIVNDTVTVNGFANCTVLTQNETMITCALPPGQGSVNTVAVTGVLGLMSGTASFSYAAPVILSTSPSRTPAAGGANITLIGNSFGFGNLTTMTLSNVACTILSKNHTVIIFVVPQGTGINKPIIVRVAGLVSAAFGFTYDAPIIYTNLPTTGPTIGGYYEILTGLNFGTIGAAVAPVASIGGVVVPISFFNDTFMNLTMSVGQGAVGVYVIVDSQVSNTRTFTFDPPSLTSLAPTHGPTNGNNTVLTLTGQSFGVTGSVYVQTSDGLTTTLCPVTGSGYGQAVIQCLLPSGQGTNLNVYVYSGFKTSNFLTFSYDPPVITSVLPLHAPTNGGTVITIVGTSFGQSGSVMVGSQACLQAGPGTSYSDLLIQCLLQAGQDVSYAIRVTTSGQTTTQTFVFNYDPPVITSLVPATGSTQGAFAITLIGANFGQVALVTFNGTLNSLGAQNCTQVGIGQSNEQITCTVPAGQGPAIPVYAQVGSQRSPLFMFSYSAPVISSISPLLASTDGSTIITLSGSNFGLGYNYTLTLDTNPSGGSRRRLLSVITLVPLTINHTVITFSMPRGTGTGKAVSLVVATQIATYTGTMIGYYAPSIDTVTGCPSHSGSVATECDYTGHQTITINGHNFGNDASLIKVTTGGLNCTSLAIVTDDTAISCALDPQPYGGKNVAVVVTVDGQTISQNYLSYAGPTITANTLIITGSGVPSSGSVTVADPLSSTPSQVTFQGTYWGTDMSKVRVTYGLPGAAKQYNCTLNTLTATGGANEYELTCTTAMGVGKDLVFVVSVGTLTTEEGVDQLSYPTPVILPNSIRHSDGLRTNAYYGVINPGDVVFFDAEHLGIDPSMITVYFAQPSQTFSTQCNSPTLSYNVDSGNTTVSCTIPQGTGINYVFEIQTLNALSASGTDVYNYPESPVVWSVSGCVDDGNQTQSCQTEGGVFVMINGSSFDTVATQLSVRIGALPCDDIISFGSNELSCLLESSSGLNQPVIVTHGSLASLPMPYLSYAAATITSVKGCVDSYPLTTGCARAGGQTITITGDNFGPIAPLVLIGGTQCLSVMGDATIPQSILYCVSPPGTKLGLPVILVQAGGPVTAADSGVTLSYEPCPAGTYPSTTNVSCLACPSNQYQDVPGQDSCQVCPAGSIPAADAKSCVQCSAGTISAAGVSSCSNCTAGFYAPLAGLTACVACGVGTYGNSTGATGCDSCAPGFASAVSNATSCTQCTAGSYTDYAGAVSCSICPAGTESTTLNNAGCTSCPAGYYSTAQSSACSACQQGYFAGQARSAQCSACDAGSFSNTTGLTSCYVCPAGSVSVKTGTQGPIKCTECTRGYYVDVSGQSQCLQCPLGSYSNVESATSCVLCDMGTYSAYLGTTSCTSCPKGQFANVNGSVACTNCPAGTFSVGPGAIACTACPAGQYQNGEGATACEQCGNGTAIATTGQAACIACEAGSFSDTAGQNACPKCPAGYFSQKAGDGSGAAFCSPCPIGTYASSGGQDQCTPCPIGFFANSTGSQTCLKCAAGYAASTTGLSSCSACPAGKFSANDGAFECTQCSAGSFSNTSSATICQSCDAGYYAGSLGATACLACDSGYYAGATGQTACSQCQAGAFSVKQPGQPLTSCQSCPAGFFQALPRATTCAACSAGSVQPAAGQAACIACTAGSYQPSTNATACIQCAAGFAVSTSNAVSCRACTPGTFALNSGSVICAQCPAGQYNARNQSTGCTECDIGYYSASAGATQCTACAAGNYASAIGAVQCPACKPGTYSASSGAGTCLSCPPGSFQSNQSSTSCALCANGTYTATTGNVACSTCPAGSVPDFYGLNGQTGSTSCTGCSPGYFLSSGGPDTCQACQPGTFTPNSGQTSCMKCVAGSFANDTAQLACYNCPAGSYQPEPGSSSCRLCNEGSYTALDGQDICTACSAGTASAVIGLSTTCDACPVGQFQNLLGQPNCTYCPVGSDAPGTGSETCSICDAGHFANETGTVNCPQCLAGTYQPQQGNASCLACPLGYYSYADGAMSCDPCPVGQFANVSGLSMCFQCEPGTINPNTGATTCDLCPLGEYQSGRGATTCVMCDQGRFTDQNGSSVCLDCDYGQYQPETGSTTCLLCSNGTYQSAPRQSACIECAVGTFANKSGLSQCFQCPSGSYESQPGASICTVCEEGFYQPAPGASSCLRCNPGEFNNLTGQTACQQCAEGTIQTQQGATNCTLCPKGSYANLPGMISCTLCGVGSANPALGASECQQCDAGSYQKTLGSTGCIQCDLGEYQDGIGATTCLSCPAGHFSDMNGSSTCEKCSAGSFQLSTSATSCDLCARGSFTALDQQTQCALCPAGYYGDTLGLTACFECPARTFQSSQGASTCDWCSAGSYTDTSGNIECVSCALGQYQNASGATSCDYCSPGSFQNGTRATFCYQCEPGFENPQTGQSSCYECKDGSATNQYGTVSCSQCLAGSVQANFGSTQCNLCPAGQYQSYNGSDDCLPCPTGSYSPSTGASSCIDCPQGTYQAQSGQSACLKCSLGYFTPNTRQTSCQACSRGQFANTTGQSACINCQPGTYGDRDAQTSCLACGNGTYATQTQQTVCDICSAGSYSIITAAANVGAISCTKCSAGSYQSVPGQSKCLPCPAGKESGLGTGNVQCSPCVVGTFSVGGAASCSACPQGQFQNVTGASDCSNCLIGQYNPSQQASGCFDCGLGTFGNATGLVQCYNCPTGTQQQHTGATTCADCDVGTYANIPGTHQCVACPAGSFSNTTHATDCTPCPIGSYQPNSGQDHCIKCPVGEYADGSGSQFCKSCGLGTYSTAIGATQCVDCDPGEYQNQPGMTSCLQCSNTTYSATNGTALCSACPQGTFGNHTGQSVCNQCVAGSYQSNVSSTTCEPCAPGFFSGAGASQCSVCGTGQVTDAYGTVNCFACPPQTTQANLLQTKCICNAGYYMPFYTPGSNDYVCVPCPDGADCTQPGTDWTNLKSLPCFWRANNVTLNFYRCQICSYCLGGMATGAPYSNDEDVDAGGEYVPTSAWNAATPCLQNRAGIMCSSCIEGYESQIGGNCVPCPTGASSFILAVLLGIGIVLLILFSFWAILRSDRHLFETFDRVDNGRELSVTLGDDSDSDSDSDSDDTDSSDESESESSQSKSSSISQSSSRSSSSATATSPSNTKSKSLNKKSVKSLGDAVDSDSAADSESDESVSSDEEVAAVAAPSSSSSVEPSNGEVHAMDFTGPPAPQENFTYKLKIMLGFLQIGTNLSSGLDIQWPSLYKQFLQYFDIINFDLILGNVTSSECIGAVTYYREFLVLLIAPIVAFVVLMFVYIFPSQYDLCCYRRQTLQSKLRTRMKFWKLFLYCLFLIYPSLSSSVLRLYVCKDIDGTKWLLTNLRVQCYTSTWWLYAYAAIPFILIYPIGIPSFFFVLLYRNRKHLLQRRVQAQLGFLYASYQRQLWWFEILDSMHKLFLTSVLAFFPNKAQLPLGMAVVTCYSMVILTLQPYLSPSDDILQLLALTELFLLCLAGWIYYNLPNATFDGTQDTFVSICLILITILFFVGFVIAFSWAFRHFALQYMAARLAKRQKQNQVKALQEEEEQLRAEKVATASDDKVKTLKFEFISDGVKGAATMEEQKESPDADADASYSSSGSDSDSLSDERADHMPDNPPLTARSSKSRDAWSEPATPGPVHDNERPSLERAASQSQQGALTSRNRPVTALCSSRHPVDADAIIAPTPRSSTQSGGSTARSQLTARMPSLQLAPAAITAHVMSSLPAREPTAVINNDAEVEEKKFSPPLASSPLQRTSLPPVRHRGSTLDRGSFIAATGSPSLQPRGSLPPLSATGSPASVKKKKRRVIRPGENAAFANAVTPQTAVTDTFKQLFG